VARHEGDWKGMMMKAWRLSVMALVVVLTASDCIGAHPTASYRALLQTEPDGSAARGVASAILYSDRQLVVNGTYQSFPGAVKVVRLTSDASGLSWCQLDHTQTKATPPTTQGTFSDTCFMGAHLMSELVSGNAWVYVYDEAFYPVLGGRLLMERTD